MRSSCLAIALVLFSIPARAVEKPHRAKLTKLDAAVYVATEFDAATTYHGLRNCGTGCVEGNPMVRPFAHNPSMFVVMGLSAYYVNYVARKLKDGGHRRWARAFQVVVIGLHASAGSHALALEH